MVAAPPPLLVRLLPLASLLTAIALLAVTLAAWLLPCSPPPPYLVLLDAGSVHTSVYTYRYSYPESGPAHIEEVGSCELGQTGVSSFADDPFTAAEFLAHHPCLTEAVSLVPESSRPSSSLLLGGTAGLRVLRLREPRLAQQILGNLTVALKAAAGTMTAQAEILDGLQEGQDGWVTANYLRGGLAGRGGLQGALDWGGASAQVTVTREEQEDVVLELSGDRFPLLSRSHLCYGQSEALNRHRASLLHQLFLASNSSLHPTALTLEDPCLPEGASVSLSLPSLLSSPCTNYRDAAFLTWAEQLPREVMLVPGAPDQCRERVEEVFQPSLCRARYLQPEQEDICLDPSSIPPPSKTGYLAFSTYWYLTSAMGLNPGPPEAPFSSSLASFDTATATFCSATLDQLETAVGSDVAPMACFQANFMRLLLTRGYHFDADSWSNITFVKRLGTPPAPPAEVGWTLGHAIIKGNSERPQEEHIKCISPPVFVVSLSLSCLLVILAAATAYQTRHRTPNPSSYETLP